MLLTDIQRYFQIKKGAIHIGAHDGEGGKEMEWYKAMGFSPVLWFEPNRGVFKRLETNTRNYEDNFTFNIGVHDTLKIAKLHITNNEESSSILELGTHSKYYPDIKYIKDEKINLVRMDDFFKSGFEGIEKFNFLNVDVQGVELNVIKSFGNMLGKLDYIYCEVNEEELYKGCALLPEIDEYVGSFGFIRLVTKISPKSHWGDALYKKYA
jgi:FkbM family methyltransferase